MRLVGWATDGGQYPSSISAPDMSHATAILLLVIVLILAATLVVGTAVIIAASRTSTSFAPTISPAPVGLLPSS